MHSRALTKCCTAMVLSLAGVLVVHAEPALVDAAMNGDVKAVRSLLRQTVDVNATQPDGMTALHWAVHRNDAEMASLLLGAGADFRAANRTGARPLYLASVNGSPELIKLLLDAGEDANAVLTTEGETVLMLTAYTGNPAAVAVLLDRGADVNARQFRGQSAVMWAAAEGHTEVVRLLIARGADLSFSSSASTKPERRPAGGMTALLFAARQGKIDTARALVEGGADINQTGADNTSPLLIAIVNGHYELASMLLDHGANPSLAASNGRTPLYAAIDLRNVQWSQGPAPELPQEQHMAMIKQLLGASADLTAKITGKVNHRGSFDMRWTDLKGGTPFLRAAWNGDIEVMRLLLEHGADPKVATEKNETALLLLAGAGWPLGQGYIRSDEEIIAALDLLVEELGMDVNEATTEGITPLMGAVFKGTNNVVQYLVDHGAKLDAKDGKGRSLLTWAAGVAANEGQPPRPQPETEKLIRELMAKQGVTIAMAN
ncbi:MAG TPA: ankyrin repeat domain-containing protein [Gammaproteobacteria bacterium]|nr:ankyrin repeat domain-containing protein [Gammaproteobacteria bacterium]